ncbi:tll1395 [Thermosynechococcus vestitus BP-1]|uniref:Tll1395 protein n=1 Tax=Thermosynechococcus vestitus (strain NIES-2133 / IAM M-273 / BP-1) TaxID=197221 RepID=Q8DJ34_THEVB|nr:tll1395 [Thermosynechococcus vestitus BP-1]
MPRGNEAEIEQKIILPLLKVWGYASSDYWSKPKLGNGYPDFLICLPLAGDRSFNYLVIEVKSSNESRLRGQQQLRGYMRAAQAVFGLLINGKDYQLFYQNPLKKPLCQLKCAAGQLDRKSIQTLTKVLHRNAAEMLVSRLTQGQLKIYHHLEKVLQKNYAFPLTHPQRTSMIITVFNHKGGVGKTTLTLNLGAAFAATGKRVLLIDIDPQSNLTIGLGIDPLKDIEDQGRKDIAHLLLEPKVTLEEVVYQKRWDNLCLDVVPSHIRLADQEADLIRTIDIDRVLQRKLKNHPYDVILIDPPPAFGKVNAIALMASHGVLVPIQFAPYPIRAIEYVLARLEAFRPVMDNPPRLLGIAVNMYDQRNSAVNAQMQQRLQGILEKVAREYAVVCHLLPENTWIPKRAAIERATDLQQPIFSRNLYRELPRADQESIDELATTFENLARHLSTETFAQHE